MSYFDYVAGRYGLATTCAVVDWQSPMPDVMLAQIRAALAAAKAR